MTTNCGDKRTIIGLFGAARALEIALQAEKHKGVLVTTPREDRSKELLEELSFFTPSTQLFHFPAEENLPFEPTTTSLEWREQRIAFLDWLHTVKRAGIGVISAHALFRKLHPPEMLWNPALTLNLKDRLHRETIKDRLIELGYIARATVERAGEFSIRGLVIDIGSPTHDYPIRITLFQNVITSIRYFHYNDQRSMQGDISSVRIHVASENLTASLLPDIDTAVERIKFRGRENEAPARDIARIMHALKVGAPIPGIENYSAIAYPLTSTIFEHIPKDFTIIAEDPILIAQQLDSHEAFIHERHATALAHHLIIPTISELYTSNNEIANKIANSATISLGSNPVFDPASKENSVTVRIEPLTALKLHIESRDDKESALAEMIAMYCNENVAVALVISSESKIERYTSTLERHGITVEKSTESGLQWFSHRSFGICTILDGYLAHSFSNATEKVVYIGSDVLATKSTAPIQKRAFKHQSTKRALARLSQFQENDLLVHIDFGIARFKGLRTITVEDKPCDFLDLEYADSKLFLPVYNIAKVSKYSAIEGTEPPLDKLSSTRWQTTKARVQADAMAIAGELIAIYASRSIPKTWRYVEIPDKERRFAETFGYEETPGQATAITETLSNMNAEQCMDRLVCGDVGFGKTEVALRAAFRALLSEKQVAVLAATTILAEQHFQTFQARLEDFGYRVACISRFQSDADNRKTIKAVKAGEVHVIIGTHRLLSKDVGFKDLGLIIVDEEQRFGVRHKEHLKRYKRSADVLTLTATPTPRTLHMSLLGIRDLSVITTPPPLRRIIQTNVAYYDEQLIRDAILRELQRGGQVFYLHNKVSDIDLVTSQLQALVPEARFAYAHGQMHEHELEAIIKSFIIKEIDVIVTTTIIESGIDIPNANTIIIERSDMFGLAQLYQLRGRVGRSDMSAYCYLLIPKGRKLTSEAALRIEALRSLEELGVGFNLASRDLEIRGAGNLLGKEQSGQVAKIGFDLYTKIMKYAIAQAQGRANEAVEYLEPEIKASYAAALHEWYIPDVTERLLTYQSITQANSAAELDTTCGEIIDSYGPLPREAESLLILGRLRIILRRFRAITCDIQSEAIILSFADHAPIDAHAFLQLVQQHPLSYKIARSNGLKIVLQKPVEPDEALRTIHEVLTLLERRS